MALGKINIDFSVVNISIEILFLLEDEKSNKAMNKHRRGVALALVMDGVLESLAGLGMKLTLGETGAMLGMEGK